MNDPAPGAVSTSESEPLVACDGLGVDGDGGALLRDVNLEIRAGEVVTVVGPNGGGKTTLLRALCGALRPSAGSIRRRADLRVGFMPQKLAVDRTLPLTVADFLALGAPAAGASERIEALSRLGVERLAHRQLADLSGGELQRALLARALLRKPNLLMMDEPTQGLDHRGEARFYQLIDTLRRELDLAILLVSHDLHVVMSASDRVICLNRHICCEGAPSHVSEHPEYLRLFGDHLLDAGGEVGDEVVAIYRHRHDHAHDHDDDHDACCGEDAAVSRAERRA